ncbi:hypothetical protein CEF21_04580 [Bacillus sp. FJAT-42376]|uniref:hypothetical protein n=1 Tax=Bacillus sp. FJAT-42376 TaxID=2014076 RepID=UPI000F4D39F8|nr:hypothetical protein [Bacillus sp. FJAT-42376]AZB41632.1 hypothetical protein CEF21_04580 [Bacillus sp. FJAT-42376]
MNGIILFAAAAFLLMTFRLVTVVRMKNAPRGNKRMAWLLYGIGIGALAGAVLVLMNTMPA